MSARKDANQVVILCLYWGHVDQKGWREGVKAAAVS